MENAGSTAHYSADSLSLHCYQQPRQPSLDVAAAAAIVVQFSSSASLPSSKPIYINAFESPSASSSSSSSASSPPPSDSDCHSSSGTSTKEDLSMEHQFYHKAATCSTQQHDAQGVNLDQQQQQTSDYMDSSMFDELESAPNGGTASAGCDSLGSAYSLTQSIIGGAMSIAGSINSSGSASGRGNRFFSDVVVDKLNKWFVENQDYPYPDEHTTSMLAQETGVSAKQVRKWFANKRVRSNRCFKQTVAAKLKSSSYPGNPNSNASSSRSRQAVRTRFQNRNVSKLIIYIVVK